MSEFMKNKVNFALALLGTLFVLFSFRDNFKGFTDAIYFEYPFNVNGSPFVIPFEAMSAVGLAAALLSLAVYFYAMAITTERSSGWLERLGNLSYALAIMVLPFYALLILSHQAAMFFGWDHLHFVVPGVLAGIAGLWLLLGIMLRVRLGKQDRRVQIRQLAHLEVDHVHRSRDMYQNSHYDLAVIEAWKGLEARLHRLLLHRGYLRHLTPAQMVEKARQIGLITPDLYQAVQHLRQQWNVAISTTPLTKEAAETALNAARKLMSTLPIEDHDPEEVAQRRV